MRAALLQEVGKVVMSEAEKPRPGPEEILLRIQATAICGSDVGVWKGKTKTRFPVIPGHETAGIVEEAGSDVQRFKAGDRVVLIPHIFCGRCEYCEQGLTSLCLNGGLMGREVPGCFAEYVTANEARAFKFSDQISFAEATNIVNLATVLTGHSKLPSLLGRSVAIIGQGAAGLLHTQVAKAAGAWPLIALDVLPWKLELGAEMGADHCINSGQRDAIEAVKELTDGHGAEVVIESVGIGSTIAQAYQMVAPGGLILQFGIGPSRVDGIDAQAYYFKNLSVLGTRSGEAEGFRIGIRLVESGKVDLKPFVTHRFPLEKLQEGFELADSGADGILRVVIDIGEG